MALVEWQNTVWFKIYLRFYKVQSKSMIQGLTRSSLKLKGYTLTKQANFVVQMISLVKWLYLIFQVMARVSALHSFSNSHIFARTSRKMLVVSGNWSPIIFSTNITKKSWRATLLVKLRENWQKGARTS